jgi:C1A family cysteine protease
MSELRPLKRRYGWVPDVPDHRDFHYSEIRVAPTKLPPKVDLRPLCPPVADQGQLNSCSASALASELEFLELKDKLPLTYLSRLFIYYGERVIENSVNSDSGAMLRDGMKALAKRGVCAEKTWPYVITKFRMKPSAASYREALRHKISSSHRLLTVEEMRACLAEGYPFVFGFTIYESFESDRVAKTGILSMPRPGEKRKYGHNAVGVGYDDSRRRFTVMNSWGPDWGIRGYFTIPYEYLADHKVAGDFWTVRRGEGM